MTFVEFDAKLQEALKIIQKAKDKEGPSNTFISIKNFHIIKKEHNQDKRGSSPVSREHGISKDEFTRIFTKFLDNFSPKNGESYHILYRKNGIGKYNDIVTTIKGNIINIETIIQHQRTSPDKYFAKPSDKIAIIENVSYFIIN